MIIFFSLFRSIYNYSIPNIPDISNLIDSYVIHVKQVLFLCGNFFDPNKNGPESTTLDGIHITLLQTVMYSFHDKPRFVAN